MPFVNTRGEKIPSFFTVVLGDLKSYIIPYLVCQGIRCGVLSLFRVREKEEKMDGNPGAAGPL